MLTLDEVQERTKKAGVPIADRTFWSYVRLGLLPNGEAIPGAGHKRFFPDDLPMPRHGDGRRDEPRVGHELFDRGSRRGPLVALRGREGRCQQEGAGEQCPEVTNIDHEKNNLYRPGAPGHSRGANRSGQRALHGVVLGSTSGSLDAARNICGVVGRLRVQ